MNPANLGDDAIVQEVTIKAPAERIFKALTSPDELVRWWGAKGKFQATQVESDLRPGGRWRITVEGDCQTGRPARSTVSGVYREIERPHLLAFTWCREEEEAIETLVRWDLEEIDGGTMVRVTHSGLNSESLRARNSGWPLILSLLHTHLEQDLHPSSFHSLVQSAK